MNIATQTVAPSAARSFYSSLTDHLFGATVCRKCGARCVDDAKAAFRELETGSRCRSHDTAIELKALSGSLLRLAGRPFAGLMVEAPEHS